MVVKRRWALGPVLVTIVVAALAPCPAGAQDRVAGLTNLLLRSGDVRVRVQAALGIGRIGDPRGRQPLEAALFDSNAAVRAAAVAALARLGDPAALSALRAHASDSEPVVRDQVQAAIQTLERAAAMAAAATAPSPSAPGNPWSNAHAWVSVGSLASTAGSPVLRQRFRDLVVNELSNGNGIVVASDAAMGREATRRHLTGYRIEGNAQISHPTPTKIRAEIRMVVLSEPGRIMLMMLNGAAIADTPPGSLAPSVEDEYAARALEAAVQRAVSNLRRTIASAGP